MVDLTVPKQSHFCKVTLNLRLLVECTPALHCGFGFLGSGSSAEQSCQSLAKERWELIFTLGKMLGEG